MNRRKYMASLAATIPLAGCQVPWERAEEMDQREPSTPEPSTPTPTPALRYPEMDKYVEMFREKIEHTDEEDGIHIRNLRHYVPTEDELQNGDIYLQYNTRGQTQWIMYQEIRIVVEGYIETKKAGMEDYHTLDSEIYYEDEKLAEFPVYGSHVEPHIEGDMSKEWAIGQVLDDLEVEE